jgi:hypothetical protein
MVFRGQKSMKNLFIIISFGSIFYLELNVKTQIKTETPVLWLTQGYIFESLNSRGFTSSISNNIANITCSNPASLLDYNKLKIGASLQFDSEIKPAWILNISHKRDDDIFIQSLGVVYPVDNYRIGAGLSQRFNSIMDLGEVEVTTIDNPEGTGERFSAIEKTNIIAYSGLFGTSFQNLLLNNDQIDLGLQLNYNTFSLEEKIYHARAYANSSSISYTVGLRYDFPQDIKIGIFFEKGAYFKDKIKLETDNLILPLDFDTTYSTNTTAQKINSNIYYSEKIPDKFHFGMLVNVLYNFDLSFDLTKIYWRQLSETCRNNMDIASGIHFSPLSGITVSFGFLSTKRIYEGELILYYNVNDQMRATYFMGGVNFHFYKFEIDIAHAKTHHFSGKWRRQNITKLALGISI